MADQTEAKSDEKDSAVSTKDSETVAKDERSEDAFIQIENEAKEENVENVGVSEHVEEIEVKRWLPRVKFFRPK